MNLVFGKNMNPAFLFFALLLIDIRDISSSETRKSSLDEPGNKLGSNHSTGNFVNLSKTDNNKPYLRLLNKWKEQSLTSSDSFQLKCRVDAWPDDDLQFTWYKDGKIFVEDEDKRRISIRDRLSTSKLTIKELYTSDSGLYRCEVSNGIFSSYISMQLEVSFNLPPVENQNAIIPESKCERYKGKACQSFLKRKQIYVDGFLTQDKMEEQINEALSYINNIKDVSENCLNYAHPVFCNFVFSPCEERSDRASKKPKAFPIQLCREECEFLKYEVCYKEYHRSKKDEFLQKIFNTGNCSTLPYSSFTTKCTKTGIISAVDQTHRCYNDTGVDYRGTVSKTANGIKCNRWPPAMISEFKELAGGHNYCRNPGGEMSQPWCYVIGDIKSICLLEKCQGQKQERKPKEENYLFVIIPTVIGFLIFICVCVVLYVYRRRKMQTQKKADNKTPISSKTAKVSSNLKNTPELDAGVLKLLGELGECRYGKAYKAELLPNPYLKPAPIAVKTVRSEFLPSDMEEFQKELEFFADIQHQNVACLKAYIQQPTIYGLVFENTNRFDLNEYLVKLSPYSDVSVSFSYKKQSLQNLDQDNIMNMTSQILSGLKYLAEKNFIHRDLATRNVLVCENQDLKISNLGVIRDSYISCYYRSPQAGQMLPIRWMAPESLQSEKFSNESTVWSFGVLLWEIYSYGLQPYCGYSNQEVIEMISGHQLLTCPDHCPARMYSMMQECWSVHPQQRPSFKEIQDKFIGWRSSQTKPMTSHLAQGINSHLANVKEDGLTVFIPQHTSQSIDGSSVSNTHSVEAHSPPHYNSYVQDPNLPSRNPQNDRHGIISESAPLLEDKNLFQLKQFSSRHQPRVYVDPSQQGIREHKKFYQNLNKPTADAKTEECVPSSINERPGNSNNFQKYSDYSDDLTVIVYDQDEVNKEKDSCVCSDKHHLQEPFVLSSNVSQSLVVKTAPSENKIQNQLHRNILHQPTAELESSDLSSTSLQAKSWDSGIPPEDFEAQTTADPSVPFVH